MKTRLRFLSFVAVIPVLAALVPAALGEPLTLAAARAAALKNHPRITVAQLRALVAQQNVVETRAGYFPLVAANVTAVDTGEQITRISSGNLSNSQIYDHTGAGATLTMLVTDFGRTASLNDAARRHARAAEADVQVTRAQLLLEVDAAYFDALKASAVQTVAAKTLALRQTVFARTNALAQNHLKSDLDVRFAQVSVDEAQLLVDGANSDEQAALVTLANLVGEKTPAALGPLEVPPPPADLPPDSAPLIALALDQRPELTRQRAEGDAARATARAARDARLPTISLAAAGGFVPTKDPHFVHNYAAAGVNLNLPLFAGGFYRARQHEAELQAGVADAALQDQLNNVTRDVRLAWLEAEHARQRIALTANLRENAASAFTLARARFDQGLSSTVELTQAELAQTSAEIAYATADFTYRVRRAILDFQTGSLR